jgi:hypothetical protein
MLLQDEEVLCNEGKPLQNGNKNAETCRGKVKAKIK